jgi:hypothetical protein
MLFRSPVFSGKQALISFDWKSRMSQQSSHFSRAVETREEVGMKFSRFSSFCAAFRFFAHPPSTQTSQPSINSITLELVNLQNGRRRPSQLIVIVTAQTNNQ